MISKFLYFLITVNLRVTWISVGEDRVYAAGVKVTYQIDTGYALERTVPDREDAIAAVPPAEHMPVDVFRFCGIF